MLLSLLLMAERGCSLPVPWFLLLKRIGVRRPLRLLPSRLLAGLLRTPVLAAVGLAALIGWTLAEVRLLLAGLAAFPQGLPLLIMGAAIGSLIPRLLNAKAAREPLPVPPLLIFAILAGCLLHIQEAGSEPGTSFVLAGLLCLPAGSMVLAGLPRLPAAAAEEGAEWLVRRLPRALFKGRENHPLPIAASHGRTALVASLLERPLDADLRDPAARRTALDDALGHAAMHGEAGLAVRLLAAGADPRREIPGWIRKGWPARSAIGLACLRAARQRDPTSLAVLSVFLDAGTDLRAPDAVGRVPMDILREILSAQELVELLAPVMPGSEEAGA